MPDRDIVHGKLARGFQKPYKILCEGKLGMEECEWIVLDAIKRDIMSRGAAPVELAGKISKCLKEALRENADENGSSDWGKKSEMLERLAQQSGGSHNTKELVLRAGKGFLHDIRYGHDFEPDRVHEAVLGRYMHEVYKADFEQRIPLTSQHHADVDAVVLEKRISTIKPGIQSAMQKWAKKAIKDGDVSKLRRPRRKKVKKVNLDEDLL